jgi:hypothetical protein
LTTCFGPAHGGGRVLAGHLADDQKVEQHADRREVLFHRRGFVGLGQHLDIGGDVMRADSGEIGRPVFLQPMEKTAYRDGVGRTRVGVADVGGEQVDETQRGMLAEIGDQRRHGRGGPTSLRSSADARYRPAG